MQANQHGQGMVVKLYVKPRDEDSKDLTMRCCGVQKCKMPHTEKGKHCCKAPGIKTPKIYHRKCPPQMKMIISQMQTRYLKEDIKRLLINFAALKPKI